MCFYTFLDPETSQETLKKPKSRKNAKKAGKKWGKNLPRKIRKNVPLVENALSRRSQKCQKMGPIFLPFSAHF